MAYPDKLNPEGPLPRGWQRITWTQIGYESHGQQVVYTEHIASAVLLRVALEGSAEVVPDSVTMGSWSDYPSGLRSCPCDKDDCPDH